MSLRLSVAEIRQRLQTLRNYQRLHAEQRVRIARLEQENRQQKEDIISLRQLIETQAIRIAELETMIFGKKRKRDDDSSSSRSSSAGSGDKKPKQQRTPDSYHRSVPNEDDVTTTNHHPVSVCKHCNSELSRFEEVVRYVEDIILPQLLGKMTKTITKHVIERGYCVHCGNWTAALPLRGQIVSFGENIKLLVTYLTTILDCSYEQVKTLTQDLYNITISDGEITNILQEQSVSYLPEYERLKKEIRSGPGVHMDETTWPIQIFAKHCYAWVMSAVHKPIRIYKLAISRGKDHATELLGEDFRGVRITDCYGAYMNMKGLHQICWAHLYRKIRDLLNNENLPAEKKPHIQAWHDEFKQLYADVRSVLDEPLKINKRLRQETALRARIDLLRRKNILDPKPLVDLKKLLVQYDHALFTCLYFDTIPCDNNRAERDLRSLVIKRKKSFGSRTEQGARAMEILLSVCWSTWHMNRSNFLQTLAQLPKKHQNA